jgi:hypothetical protein
MMGGALVLAGVIQEMGAGLWPLCLFSTIGALAGLLGFELLFLLIDSL